MVDMTVIEQKPISMAELKDKLESIKKDDKELNFRAEKVYVHLQEFITLDKKDAEEKYKKISELGIQRLKEKHIVKIIDIMPEDPESLKMLFAGETISLKQEELKQILDALNG